MAQFAGITIEVYREPPVLQPVGFRAVTIEQYKPVPDPQVFFRGVTIEQFRPVKRCRMCSKRWW